MAYFHSVKLDKSKCHGCTNCISHCPTEAIRVRHGKAKIIKQRCIDCGECIRVCPSHAKISASDSFEDLKSYKYNIAMPAPSFYSQFGGNVCVDRILTAFLEIGFDDVFEVARGAEIVSAATRKLLETQTLKKPVISSACPAVMRLMHERFPELLEYALPLISPMEAAAKLAREEAREKTGLSDEEIGVFFISPCPAKVTSIKAPLTLEKSYVSGAIAAKDAYLKIRPIINRIENVRKLSVSGSAGIVWAKSGGESKGSGVEDCIAVDGIDNVIKILEEIEYGKLNNVEFIELAACTSGCSGGALNIENPFLAARRIALLSKKQTGERELPKVDVESLKWQKTVTGRKHSGLDEDFDKAMEKMEQMDAIYERLPKMDCGSCGAPSCKALAEDVVRGYGTENDCIFIMRERIRELATELYELNESFDASKK